MAQSHKATILIIEDDPSFVRVYTDVLETDGYLVLTAEDGERGWQLAKSEKPSLIILDLVLPKLHGFEVLKNLRADQETKNIPVIIFSILGQQKDVQKGLELGANDYTVKGMYSPREILSKVRALLTKTDISKNLTRYRLGIKEGREDAAKLEQDFGFTKLFRCPHCQNELLLELVPDLAQTQGHWFSAHFVCPNCGREF